MEKPAAIATQLTPPPMASPPCANAGTAKQNTDKYMNKLLSLRIVHLLMTMNYRQWVVDAIPCRRPHAGGSFSALPLLRRPSTRSSAGQKCMSEAVTPRYADREK